MEIGIDSFAAAMFNNTKDTATRNADAIGQLLERIEHADKAGLDVFGIGEHHRERIFRLGTNYDTCSRCGAY
jgi:alkanesulfonate monooxygenase SsuD/methylene tetrahydromethanopterin reductase-like flavin-dependent oxidoreductase (luciferase family)